MTGTASAVSCSVPFSPQFFLPRFLQGAVGRNQLQVLKSVAFSTALRNDYEKFLVDPKKMASFVATKVRPVVYPHNVQVLRTRYRAEMIKTTLR